MSKKKNPPTSSPPKPGKESLVKTPSKTNILSWAVFIPTLVVVFISLIAVVFPALIPRTTSILYSAILNADVIDPYTPGVLALPLIVVNVIILAIGVGYYKRSKGLSIFKSISNFDLSKKRATIVVIALLVIFISLTVGSLTKEETWTDYVDVKSKVQNWTLSDFSKNFDTHFKFLLLSISLKIFGNIRIIPMIASVALLLLTYFFTVKITGKKFAGVVSMALVLQSNIFIFYSTTASFDNVWILLYLFSLYLIEKFWHPSPVPYFLSIFSKALTVAFLPMSFYFIARSSLSRRSKIYSLASYGVIIIMFFIMNFFYLITYNKNLVGTAIAFSNLNFWQGFDAMAMQMRFDYIVILFLLPLVVMLFFASRKGILHADSILIFILSILLIAPLLTGYTQQTNEPYRFVSLLVFFSIGIGVLLSNKTRTKVEVLSSK